MTLSVGPALTRDEALKLVQEQGANVIIPNTFTSIDENAFKNLGISSVFIPGSITNIGSSAFENNRLTEVVISEGVGHIFSRAFADNELTKLTLPNSLNVLGIEAFIGNSLTDLDPGGANIIGQRAFFGNKLTQVAFIERKATLSIDEEAFAFNKIETVRFPQGEGALLIKSNAFSGNLISEVFIPDKVNGFSGPVTSIGDGSFAGNPIQIAFVPKNKVRESFRAFDSSVDIVIRNEGVIESTESLRLSNAINNLFLVGDAKINGVGNRRKNIIVGNDARNILKGQNGDDILIGNGGKDVMEGGNGDDTFIFRSITDSGTSKKSRDTITDFSEGDAIDLRQIDANSVVRGNQALEFIGMREFTDAGQVRFVNGMLSVNTEGDLNADFQVKIKGVTELFVGSLVI